MTMRSGAFRALLIIFPLFVVLVAVARWNPTGDYWGGVEPPKAQCEAYDTDRLRTTSTLTAEIYDQRKLDRLFREPQNTVSNLGYAFVGLAVFFSARHRLSKNLGIACIFLATGSGLYHASLLPEWRLIDILGVYAALMSIAVIGVVSVVRRFAPNYDFLLAIVIWIVAVTTGIHRNDFRFGGFKPLDSKTIVVACVAVGSACALFGIRQLKSVHTRRWKWALSALLVSAPIAFFGGLADRFGGVLASPKAAIQGHSLWHGLGAVALLAAYEMYAATGFDRSVFESVRDGTRPELQPRTASTADLVSRETLRIHDSLRRER